MIRNGNCICSDINNWSVISFKRSYKNIVTVMSQFKFSLDVSISSSIFPISSFYCSISKINNALCVIFNSKCISINMNSCINSWYWSKENLSCCSKSYRISNYFWSKSTKSRMSFNICKFSIKGFSSRFSFNVIIYNKIL